MASKFTAAVLAAAFALLQTACTDRSDCPELLGYWTKGDGQAFVFQSDGRALWLTRFGSQTDTMTSDFQLDCSQEPAAIDFTNFSDGPYQNRELRGIIQWKNPELFQLRCEAGASRPTKFDENTMVFERK